MSRNCCSGWRLFGDCGEVMVVDHTTHRGCDEDTRPPVVVVAVVAAAAERVGRDQKARAAMAAVRHNTVACRKAPKVAAAGRCLAAVELLAVSLVAKVLKSLVGVIACLDLGTRSCLHLS